LKTADGRSKYGSIPLFAAGAVLALVVVLAFWPVVSGARSFFHLDLRYEYLPIWHVVQSALSEGHSPFWIDGEYCGEPLLFHQEAPIFHPLIAPLLATGAPVHRLSDLFSLFHFWLAGFGAFLFLRDRRCDVASALFGGVAWMLSARMVQSAIWPNAVAVQALLPILLLGLFRLADGRRRSGVIIASIAGGIALLAARPQSLLGAAPILVGTTLAVIVLSRDRASTVKDLASVGVLALLLGAPALLPSALIYPETSRALGLTESQRDWNSLTAGGDLDQVFLPVDGPARWPEAAAYPGVLVAILFAVAVVLAFEPAERTFRGVLVGLLFGGIAGLVFAFGASGPLAPVARLPLIRGFRIPARYLGSWSLALALLAGLALAALVARSNLAARLAVPFVVLLSADLVLHARLAAPTAPSAFHSLEPRLASGLRARLRPDAAGFPRRVWSTVFPPPLWTFDDPEKLAFAREREPLYGALPMRFGLEAVSGQGPSPKRWNLLFRRPARRLAELAGVGAFVSRIPSGPGRPPRLFVEELEGLPRAIAVSDWIVVPPSQAVSTVLDASFDPRRTAVLEVETPPRGAPKWEPDSASVRLRSRAPGRVSLEVTLPGEGILVVFQTFEAGWRATVNGIPRPLLAADAAFQGVRLEAGKHVVELEYHPRGLIPGIAAAAVGIVALGILAARWRPGGSG
jgi:membrane protein YfhO